jgi:voltage-gated potassium channel
METDGGTPEQDGWRRRWHEIIFESDTPAGRRFDVWLLVAIVLSVGVVMLESVPAIDARHGAALRIAEWVFTVLFTIEYFVRLRCVQRPMGYALSFFGIVDLLAIAPTFASLLIPGAQALAVVRTLRLLRVFRVLKLVHYLKEMQVLTQALRASRRKIAVFISTVLTAVVVLGSMMYLVEGAEHGFTSIPMSVYWAIVTLTTVGYGDISPQTPLGQVLASVIMILGYGLIAVPTGVVTVEIAQAGRGGASTTSGRSCPHCSAEGHPGGAKFCHVCGGAL